MPASPLLGSIKEIAVFLGKKLDKVIDALKGIKEPKPTDMGPVVSMLKKILDKDTAFDVSVDTSALEGEVRTATSALKALSIPDTKPIETLLSNILVATNANAKAISALASKEHPKSEIKIPDTFKLDEMQVRSMSQRMPLNPAPLAPRSVTLTNVSLTTADTQYSHTFGNNCVSFQLRVRADDVPLLVAYTSGKLPTSGDGSAYFSVPSYFIERNSGLDWGGKTIYLQTGSSSQVVEIIEYRA